MAAEIICVGTELLLGDILNSNAQFLAGELARLGIPHYFQTVVGDNPQRLQQAIATALDRCNLLVFTGGLGPTPDDLTVEAIADFFGVPLISRKEILDDLERKYAARNRILSPSNRKQALLPQGASVLPNPTGTAPGIVWEPQAGKIVLTFPGVPREMKRMWQETAVPYLRSIGWGQETIHSRTLKFWGIAESVLAERAASFLDMPNPTVAPYASQGIVKLRVSARATSIEAALQQIAPVEERLREIGGENYFGCDDDTLAIAVGRLLRDRNETLAVAESCTGGGLGREITSVPGSSAYFLGGIVAYDNRVKANLLGVSSRIWNDTAR